MFLCIHLTDTYWVLLCDRYWHTLVAKIDKDFCLHGAFILILNLFQLGLYYFPADRISQGQCTDIWADGNQDPETTPFLPLPVEGVNKRAITKDVKKLGNSWQGSCQACRAVKKKGEREKGGEISLGRETEQRQLLPLQTHWRLFQAFSQSVNLPTTLGPKFCRVCCWRGGRALTTSH